MLLPRYPLVADQTLIAGGNQRRGGEVKRTQRRKSKHAFVAGALLSLACLAGCGGEAKTTTVTVTAAEGTSSIQATIQTTTPAPAATTRGAIGEALTLDEEYTLNGDPIDVQLEATLLSVETARPDPIAAGGLEKAGHRWVRADVRLENKGDALTQSTSDFVLMDSDGRRYLQTTDVFQPSLGNGAADLQQGDVLRGFLTYQVPARSKLTRLRLEAGYDTAAAVTWDLGQGG